MPENPERLEEILRDLRADALTAYKASGAAEEEADAAFNEGRAVAFGLAANRIAGEIEEIRHA